VPHDRKEVARLDRREETRSTTERVAEYIVSARDQPLDEPTVHAARRHLLDTIACIVGAATLRPADVVMQLYGEWGGVAESTVPGSALRLPAIHAAYINGQLANLLDFDDSELGLGHPGAAIIPGALAIAELVDANLSELLRAVVTGYEVAQRVGRYLQPSNERNAAVWGYATWQSLGAVAAAASLMRLSVPQTCAAMGIYGVSAPVPALWKLGFDPADRPFSWVKNNYGSSSATAVQAAMLAARGFVGNRNVFDGPRGFWIMAGSDQYREDALTNGLGSGAPLITRCSLKPYACCLWTHTTLDVIRALQAAHRFRVEDIAAVEIATASVLATEFTGEAPRSIIDAQFHLPHVAALELMGRSSCAGLAEHDLDDPAIQTLRNRVTVTVDDDADRAFVMREGCPARVTIRLLKGIEISDAANTSWGLPGGPEFTASDAERKAESLLTPALGHGRVLELQTALRAGAPVRDFLALTLLERDVPHASQGPR
jgi:2-methylcitrate dehydratase PrpD